MILSRAPVLHQQRARRSSVACSSVTAPAWLASVMPRRQAAVHVRLPRVIETGVQDVSRLMLKDWGSQRFLEKAGLKVEPVQGSPPAGTRGAMRTVELLDGPSRGVTYTHVLDSLRGPKESPRGVTLSLASAGYRADPSNDDWTGMASQGHDAAAKAALERLPRYTKVKLELIPSFRHRTVIVWDVDAEVPPALDAEKTREIVLAELGAITDAAKEVLDASR